MSTLLDIGPIHHEAWSCIEDLIISATSWWKRDHELMFADAWSFLFERTGPALPETLGECLNEGEDNTWACLDFYHGIQLVPFFTAAAVEALDAIRAELLQRRPVIVYIDAYWCAWCRVYQKSSFPHTCLVIGCDDENAHLTCIDPYNTKSIESLSLNDYQQGYSRYALFQLKDPVAGQVDWRKILHASANRMLREECFSNRFTMMRHFADAVEQSLDPVKETRGNTDLLKSPLYERLKYIIRRRIQFSQVLTYLGKRCDMPDVAPLVASFEHAGQLWEVIRNLMIKLYYLNDIPSMKSKAAAKIREAADYEEALAHELLEFGR